MTDLTYDTINLDEGYIEVGPLLFTAQSFTRSNGTIAARIYERLTKAIRRRVTASNENWLFGTINAYDHTDVDVDEMHYRRGVKDALEALRAELS